MSTFALVASFAMMCLTSSKVILNRTQPFDIYFQGQRNSGFSTYTRWGSSACSTNVETVYTGFIGGSYSGYSGSGTNYLCVTDDPVYDNHPIPAAGFAYLYGTEYEVYPEDRHNLSPTCSVCRIPRATNIMIPATSKCTFGWKLEYSGYLMAGHYGQTASSHYICVDSAFNFLLGTQADLGGALLYYTLSRCGSLPCPPYVNDKIVSCVVCSK